MGATFGNIHIYNQQKLSKNALIDKLVEGFKSLDYEVSNQKRADLQLKILYNPSKKWICIFTDDIDSINVKDLKRIGNFYHKMFLTDIITSHVVDSDALLMYVKGKKTDLYVSVADDNNMTYYSHDANISRGTIDKWKHLLETQYQQTELLDIWNKNYIFAEEKLAAIGQMIGFDELLSKNGFSYFNDIEEEVTLNYEVLSLSFDNKEKPLKISYKEGFPFLKRRGWTQLLEMDNIYPGHVFYNDGGNSKGLIIEINSSDTDSIIFESIEISQRKSVYHANGWSGFSIINIQKAVFSKVSEKKCKAEFPEFEIAPGLSVEYFHDIQKKKGISHQKIQSVVDDQRLTCEYFVVIKAVSSQIVSSKIELKITPIDNPGGFVEFKYMLTNDKKTIDAYHLREIDIYSEDEFEDLI
jgi:hypothetical protein